MFALAQGVFLAGVAATLAISVGTAVTTGALACAAAFAKSFSLRVAAGENLRVNFIARVFEFAAAALVLMFGLALWIGGRAGGA